MLAFITWPMLLWGAALGGIPIVIHLLHKRRYRETPWAAMRFLVEAARKHSRRIRLEQLLLMAVRMLILLFLVAALQGKYTESSQTLVGRSGPTHRIIVLDSSYSMQHRPDGAASRFESARDEALTIADAARPSDLVNVVQITGGSPRTVVRKPAHPTQALAAELRRLTPTEERGDLSATLREVVSLLHAKDAEDVPRKEVYFLSDFQRETWLPGSSAERGGIRKSLNDLSETAGLMFVDVGRERAWNTAVTEFSAAEPFVVAGRPIQLEATLRNFGDVPLKERTLELYIDGKLADTRQVDLASHGTARVEIVYPDESRGQRRLSSGEHSFEVRLQEDALPLDNNRWLSLPVRERLNVLLVNGKPSGDETENATWFLSKALDPAGRDGPSPGFVRPRVITEGELPGTDLGLYDCVFLCNVRMFTQPEARRLRAFVESGGGLVVCLGDQVDLDNYNDLLHERGEGLLPAKLIEPVELPPGAARAYEFDTGELNHPILNPFVGNPGTGLETVFTLEYVRAEVADGSRANVVLRFQKTDTSPAGSKGDPVMVEAPVGRGRAVLLTTSVDARWSTWASVNPSFLPMMHETVHFAVAGRWSQRQRQVGQPLTRGYPLQGMNMPGRARLKLPDGRERSVPLTAADGFAGLSFGATDRSGLYELLLEPPLGPSELFAVNVDPEEGDLAKATEDELRTELLPGVDFLYRTDWKSTDRPLDLAGTERSELTNWLLVAALCLVLIEVLMAWNFFYGFLLLYAVVAAAFVRQMILWTAVGGSLLAVTFVAGFAVIVLVARRPWRSSLRSRFGWSR